jgi:hypothetical protein
MNQISVINPSIFSKNLSLRLNLKIFWTTAFILVLLLLAFYVFQISKFIYEIYTLRNYQKMVTKISEENKILEVNLVKTSSLSEIIPKVNEMGFEKIKAINYIQVTDDSIVRR